MNKKMITLITATVLIGTLAGCSPARNVEAIPKDPKPVATKEVEAIEEPAAEVVVAALGSRENPVPVGQQTKISDVSAFTVGAAGATEVHDTYSILPLAVTVDWPVLEQQIAESGGVAGSGVDVYMTLTVRFVTAAGKSYDSMTDYSIEIPNDWYQVGTLYAPAAVTTANWGVSVPAGEVEGGTWIVANYKGDQVFLAAK